MPVKIVSRFDSSNGCRTFNTTDAYRDHVQRKYPGTPKAAETLAILSFIDTVSEI